MFPFATFGDDKAAVRMKGTDMKMNSWIGILLSISTAGGAFAACSDPAAPKVDWSGCERQGAALAEANLSGADLRGADFRDADLRRANLEGADVAEADFSHADLSRTIWVDGRTCGIGSDGECY